MRAYLVITSCSLLAACAPVTGDGVARTETRTLDEAFDGVAVEGRLRLEVITADPRPLTVTADANLLEHLDTVVEDRTLQVRPATGIEPMVPPEVVLGVGTLAYASARETGSVVLAHRIAAQRFGLAASQGATAQAGGTCETLRAIASDQGSIHARSLVCTSGRVDALSGARVEVTVTGSIEIHAEGQSEVIVHGNPATVIRFLTDGSTVTLVP